MLNENNHEAAPTGGCAAVTWQEAHRIADRNRVSECLMAFSHDSTEDNGICVVRAVLEAAQPAAAIRSAGLSDDNLASDIDFALSLIKRADGAGCDSAIAWLQGLERYIIGRCNKSWGAGFADGREVGRLDSPTAAEVRREALESPWQPIETAPKDGRVLLLGHFNQYGNWRAARGRWVNQSYIDEYFEDPEGSQPGWFEDSVENDNDENMWATTPTHWSPMPPAPQSTPATAGQGEAS